MRGLGWLEDLHCAGTAASGLGCGRAMVFQGRTAFGACPLAMAKVTGTCARVSPEFCPSFVANAEKERKLGKKGDPTQETSVSRCVSAQS